jgi:hypothetical protein
VRLDGAPEVDGLTARATERELDGVH